MKVWDTEKSIRARLAEHLAGEGTLNDSTTEALFREWFCLDEGVETELERVEAWAHDLLNA